MSAIYDIFEIVNVTHDFWLIDSESYQRRYRTRHGQPLAPGYYIVNWPDQIDERRFNELAAFHGPFVYRGEAQRNLDWMRKEREHYLKMPSHIPSILTLNSIPLNHTV